MIETYLRERETLRLVVLILDVRRDPAEEDLQLLGWLRHYRLPVLVVLTKIDKLVWSQRALRQRLIAAQLDLPAGVETLLFSARTGEGKDLLWGEISRAVSAEQGG